MGLFTNIFDGKRSVQIPVDQSGKDHILSVETLRAYFPKASSISHKDGKVLRALKVQNGFITLNPTVNKYGLFFPVDNGPVSAMKAKRHLEVLDLIKMNDNKKSRVLEEPKDKSIKIIWKHQGLTDAKPSQVTAPIISSEALRDVKLSADENFFLNELVDWIISQIRTKCNESMFINSDVHLMTYEGQAIHSFQNEAGEACTFQACIDLFRLPCGKVSVYSITIEKSIEISQVRVPLHGRAAESEPQSRNQSDSYSSSFGEAYSQAKNVRNTHNQKTGAQGVVLPKKVPKSYVPKSKNRERKSATTLNDPSEQKTLYKDYISKCMGKTFDSASNHSSEDENSENNSLHRQSSVASPKDFNGNRFRQKLSKSSQDQTVDDYKSRSSHVTASDTDTFKLDQDRRIFHKKSSTINGRHGDQNASFTYSKNQFTNSHGSSGDFFSQSAYGCNSKTQLSYSSKDRNVLSITSIKRMPSSQKSVDSTVTLNNSLHSRQKSVDLTVTSDNSMHSHQRFESRNVTSNSTVRSHQTSDNPSEDAVKSLNLELPLDVIPLKDIEFFESAKLESGTFGEVRKGKWAGDDVAVKELALDEFSNNLNTVRELAIMAKSRQRNVVSISGYCVETGSCHIIMEHVDGANLRGILYVDDVMKQFDLTDSGRVSLSLQLPKAVQYLHYMRVIHRDIKPENILVDRVWNLKLFDFGYSKISIAEPDDFNSYVPCKRIGTTLYNAPEILLRNEPASAKSEVKQLIESQKIPSLEGVPDEIKNALIPCFDEESTTRPEISHLTSFFTDQSKKL